MPFVNNTFSPCRFTDQQSDESGSSVDPVRELRPLDTNTALHWIKRLFHPDKPTDYWVHALRSLDADKLRGLLDGATNAAYQGHLTREQCKALFTGPKSLAKAPDTPALALFRLATEGGAADVARLTRFLQALQYAATHDVLRRDDLLSALGQGHEHGPVARAWDKKPAGRPVRTQDALEAWAGGCAQLSMRGPLEVRDAMALMVPDRRFTDDRSSFLANTWHMNLLFRTVAGLLIHGGLDDLPPEDRERSLARARELLLALMGTDGTTRSDMAQLAGATDELRQRSVKNLAGAMLLMEFKDREIEAVTGVPRQRDGGQSRLPR